MPRLKVDSCKHLLHAYKYMPISLKINEINTIYAEKYEKILLFVSRNAESVRISSPEPKYFVVIRPLQHAQSILQRKASDNQWNWSSISTSGCQDAQ